MSRVVVAWKPREAKESMAASSSRRAASGRSPGHRSARCGSVVMVDILARGPAESGGRLTVWPGDKMLSKRLVT